ncbi:Uncharacterised protein [Escherichia coli]|nr:Uncharacterised protein [Escherichia coli]
MMKMELWFALQLKLYMLQSRIYLLKKNHF